MENLTLLVFSRLCFFAFLGLEKKKTTWRVGGSRDLESDGAAFPRNLLKHVTLAKMIPLNFPRVVLCYREVLQFPSLLILRLMEQERADNIEFILGAFYEGVS
jgi:hypothetical protein